MCRVEIILIVFFLWSLFILFFCLGKKKIRWSIYLFRGTKKQSSSSKKWRLSIEKKKKLDSLFFTRFIKPLPPVLVFKKDDDFDDDNALSSV